LLSKPNIWFVHDVCSFSFGLPWLPRHKGVTSGRSLGYSVGFADSLRGKFGFYENHELPDFAQLGGAGG
jgi:hypothetical protein